MSFENLLVKAYDLLEREKFDGAREIFEKIIDDGEYSGSAYWGALLCKRNLASDEELIAVGVPIDDEELYEKACTFGNAEECARFERVYDGIGETMNAKLARAIEAGDVWTASRWADRIKANETYAERYSDEVAYARVFCLTDGFRDFDLSNKKAYGAALRELRETKNASLIARFEENLDGLFEALNGRLANAVEKSKRDVADLYDRATAVCQSRPESHLLIFGYCKKNMIDPTNDLFERAVRGARESLPADKAAEFKKEVDEYKARYTEKIEQDRADAEYIRNRKIIRESEAKIASSRGMDSFKASETLGEVIDALERISDFDGVAPILEEARRLCREEKSYIAALEAKEKRKKKATRAVVLVLLLAAIAFAVYYFVAMRPAGAYSDAESLLSSGKYEDAAFAFAELGNYKDSAERAREARYLLAGRLASNGDPLGAYMIYGELGSYSDSAAKRTALAPALDAIAAGSTLTFGRYEQNDEKSDGAEAIEWTVLDREGDTLFLISRYVLDGKYLHNNGDFSGSYVKWEETDLCDWINDDFYNDAFSNAEKRMIANPRGASSDAGETLTRPVFILSANELKRYYGIDVNFKGERNEGSIAYATAYALDRDPYVEGNASSWWLRSAGYSAGDACAVRPNGKIGITYSPDGIKYGVRPCIRVDLSK